MNIKIFIVTPPPTDSGVDIISQKKVISLGRAIVIQV
jgi:hypothetical protein